MDYSWIKYVADISDDLTNITFGQMFNQKIEPNSLPNNLKSLIFVFNSEFNQKIKPNSLPNNLSNLTLGWKFNQSMKYLLEKIDSINFNWLSEYINCRKKDKDLHLINHIPRYFNVRIYVNNNIFNDNGSYWSSMKNNISNYFNAEQQVENHNKEPIWPVHVVNYNKLKWSPKIYEIIDKYMDPIYGDITVLINKKSFQPYAHSKSARN